MLSTIFGYADFWERTFVTAMMFFAVGIFMFLASSSGYPPLWFRVIVRTMILASVPAAMISATVIIWS
jgi:hypothetical protein